MKHIRLIRKIVQLSVIVLFCALPFMASLGFTLISGSLFGLDFFGLPFADPASAIQMAGQSMWFSVLPYTEIFVGALLSLLLAFCMGRVFCGWICPYGFFSELTFRNKKSWTRAGHLKTVIFISSLILAVILGYPVISWLSMPGQLTLAPMVFGTDWLTFALLLSVPLLALILDLLLGWRFFCGSVCPQSLLLGWSAKMLPKTMPGLRIAWDKNRCNCKNSFCDKACQFSLKPRKNPSRAQCVMCGDCIAACSNHGKALHWTFTNQTGIPKKPDASDQYKSA